jgi:hypothetical protein
LAALAIALVAGGLLAWYLNTPRGYVRRVFFSIPRPPGSREIGREVRDWAEGPACPYARLNVAYATDASWAEVAAFYQNYMQTSGWGGAERRALGRDLIANIDQEMIEGRWPFPAAPSRQELMLTIVNYYQLASPPPATSQTVFTIGVEYIPDVDFFRSSELCQD